MVEIDDTIRRVLEAEGDPFDKVGTIIDAYVDMVAAHPQRTKILLRSPSATRRRPTCRRPKRTMCST